MFVITCYCFVVVILVVNNDNHNHYIHFSIWLYVVNDVVAVAANVEMYVGNIINIRSGNETQNTPFYLKDIRFKLINKYINTNKWK